MNKTGSKIRENEEIKAKESEKQENSQEVNDLLERLLKGEDLYETVETKRGAFKILYPKPRTIRLIQVLLSNRFPDINLNHIPIAKLRNAEVYATLDAVIVEAPKWWDDLESSEDCPDDELILLLYRRYLRFYNTVQQKISSGAKQSGRGNKTKPDRLEKEALDTGAFSGIAYGQEDTRING